MALSKDELIERLQSLQIVHETIGHALSPTCELHSANIKGTQFEKYIGKGQAKNLFFKVPSGVGPLKNRLFLVCALVETNVDNKLLSSRMGIKPSSPLRFASDDIFTDVLQIPQGSVNPFVMAQTSCSEVVLLLDKQFLQCERLLFHPMQSDYTTALTPEQLSALLEQVAPGRYMYVDLAADEKIVIPDLGAAPAAKAKAQAPRKQVPAGVQASHGFRDGKVSDALAAVGAAITADPVGQLNEAGRLRGHSTHNFFVHDKKDKEKRMLVTIAQSSAVAMKDIPSLVGSKEVRLCTEGDSLLGSAKGCITPLSLVYDENCKVQWYLDDALLTEEVWRLGTSEEGTSAGTVADVPVARLQDLLGPTGHWASKRNLDCSRWAGKTKESSVACTSSSSLHVTRPSDTDFSTWHQPPYETASGWVL